MHGRPPHCSGSKVIRSWYFIGAQRKAPRVPGQPRRAHSDAAITSSPPPAARRFRPGIRSALSTANRRGGDLVSDAGDRWRVDVVQQACRVPHAQHSSIRLEHRKVAMRNLDRRPLGDMHGEWSGRQSTENSLEFIRGHGRRIPRVPVDDKWPPPRSLLPRRLLRVVFGPEFGGGLRGDIQVLFAQCAAVAETL